jgi:D-glycero-D-manno-heptose 1,7-bisphosphate phosphatase
MKKSSSRRPAVFLDRDGTLIPDVSYLSGLTQVRLFPFTARALKLLKKAGFRLFVVTNQSGVARGYFPENMVKKAHRKIQGLLKARGAGIDGFFYCPHYPQGKVKCFSRVCGCRKPKAGMVKEAARRFPLDLNRSFMVGDKMDDLLLAKKARLAKGLLVRTGNGRKTEKEMTGKERIKTVIVGDILKAARWILRSSNKNSFTTKGTKNNKRQR